ncbi:serine/threonine protein kinase [Kitasatospora sp. NBC_01287]|uniref:serine/threonine-protein kinase n=1 Tax=Kitasatospora sp. NBC_01287 TaxID=2903573 RepID=UPI00225BB94B|nr:serine/threonine-protein kinase [Kitasatospora sp. NBC_01287]MCX4748915.1 serine/threonine protein kinase [Kitasatospora sp. NBC_01287]
MRPLGATDERVVGQYRMIAELGSGGMGRVLLGSGPDGRLVALKQVRTQFVEDEGFRARFRREVTASRKVSGAYTAAVIDADTEAPTPWLASVFVPGLSLREVVEKAGALPPGEALRLAAGLVGALGEIHRAGLVHRDLTPSNVLLTDDGCRVIDFGIARATDGEAGTELTRSGWLVGAPGYMSPEQAEGRAVGPAGDVFSLGTVLFMACTGAGPFAGPSTPQVLYNVVHTEPDLRKLTVELRRIIEPCLAKDPAARPKPAELGATIGRLTPSARPWPAAVHRLIAEQRVAVHQLVETAGTAEAVTLSGPLPPPTDPTLLATRVFQIAGEKAGTAFGVVRALLPVFLVAARTHLAAAAAKARAIVAGLRGRLPDRTAAGPGVRRALTGVRDTVVAVAGVAAGVFVAADANRGRVIDLRHTTYFRRTAGYPVLSDVLAHATYVGALTGAGLGALAGGLVCAIGGVRTRLLGRLVPLMAAVGFLLGWYAEHGHLRIDVLSLGFSGAVGLRVGLGIGLAPLLLLLRAKERGAGIVLPVLLLTFLTAVVGCACGYWGLIGIVLGGSTKIEPATVLGAAVGAGVAWRSTQRLRGKPVARKR